MATYSLGVFAATMGVITLREIHEREVFPFDEQAQRKFFKTCGKLKFDFDHEPVRTIVFYDAVEKSPRDIYEAMYCTEKPPISYAIGWLYEDFADDIINWGYVERPSKKLGEIKISYGGELTESRIEVKSYKSNFIWANYVKETPEPTIEKSGGCFIATAAYGSSLAPEVVTFRRFRDEVLLNSNLGAAVVDLYYAVSPPIAKLISNSSFLRTATRKILLEPILKMIKDA